MTSWRRLFAAAAIAALSPNAGLPAMAEPPVTVTESDPLDRLIDAYAALHADLDPSEAARNAGRPVAHWPSVRPERLAGQARRAEALRLELQRLDTARRIDASILDRLLQRLVDAVAFDAARVPFTGDHGFHSEPVFAAMRTRVRNEEDARAWIARLEDLPRYFAEHVGNMRRGIETGWTAHGDPLATTLDQVREQVVERPADSDLFAPLTRLPESLPADTRLALRTEGEEAVRGAIAAYADLLHFLESEYAPHARATPGLASLPGGRRAYAAAVADHTAGAGYTPEEIHALGKTEVARIRAEMDAIVRETGFGGEFGDFIRYLRTDAQFYARTPDDLLEKASAIAKRLDGILPRYFTRLPRLPYGVSPVPASIAPGYTTGRYAQGDARDGRAGAYLVNTYRLDQRPLYELPALTAHEAVPGHHLQIALAQELRHVPEYRRRYYATAFGEGWALYAERLAGEAGIYRTPYERFGALSYEMWRACRLVADTGLHWYGWSREQAERCFQENTALSPLNIQIEVTRYIGWPGQATAYKIGELKIRALRARAEAELGPAFDLRGFHDHLLADGSVPLSVLDDRLTRWIASERAGVPETGGTAP